jgi:hypothetical protein
MEQASFVPSHCENPSGEQAGSGTRASAVGLETPVRTVNDTAAIRPNRSPIVEPEQPLAAQKAELNSIFTIGKSHSKKKLRYGKLKLSAPGRAAGTPPKKRGAPLGNRNALKHGDHTREIRAFYAGIRWHLRHGRALLAMARTISQPQHGV